MDFSLAQKKQNAWQRMFPHLDIARAPDHCQGETEDCFSVWMMGDLAVTRASFAAAELRRTAARIRADGQDVFYFAVLSRGTWCGRVADSDLTVGPGELVAFDLSRPLSIVATACECVIVSVGRAALLNAVGVEPKFAGHVFRSAAGALLTDHCLSLARHIGSVQVEQIAAIRAATLAHIGAAVTLLPWHDATKPVLLKMQHAVRSYIDLHITDENLSPDKIRHAIGVSRSSLYRAFQDKGGIDAYIRDRRLEAVRAALLMPDEDRSISELAQTFGFTRPSHLATAFRRAFGCSPNSLRASVPKVRSRVSRPALG